MMFDIFCSFTMPGGLLSTFQQASKTARHINQEFTGQWSEEQILVKERELHQRV
jgi:hypothetical protein